MTVIDGGGFRPAPTPDVRLYAAAPALLKAARASVAALVPALDGAYWSQEQRILAAIHTLKAAIEQAEGDGHDPK